MRHPLALPAVGVAALPWLALLLLFVACAPEGPAARADPGVLMEADRTFAAAVDTGGSRAWARWFAEDGRMVQPGVGMVEGRDDIEDLMGALDDPAFSMAWEPDHAEVAASGDLGWTTGTYVARRAEPGAEGTRQTGRYVSIWRKDADGRWKVVMDLGNPTEPAPEG